MPVVRITLYWYLALILVQCICYVAARLRGIRLPDFEEVPVIGWSAGEMNLVSFGCLCCV
ncbi:MAG TPA: hypothetical protein VMA98_08940 [Candidatus Acidoferrales bacterium]|nr:hypothetical protein [Candidatus Acidoferrales bacterium]